MPNTIYEVELPGGKILEIEAPKGTSPDIIRQRAKQYRYESLKAELEARNGAQGPDMASSMSRIDQMLVGAGRGFTELGQGTKQLGLHAAAAIADALSPTQKTLSGLITGQQPKSGWRARADAYDKAISDEAA